MTDWFYVLFGSNGTLTPVLTVLMFVLGYLLRPKLESREPAKTQSSLGPTPATGSPEGTTATGAIRLSELLVQQVSGALRIADRIFDYSRWMAVSFFGAGLMLGILILSYSLSYDRYSAAWYLISVGSLADFGAVVFGLYKGRRALLRARTDLDEMKAGGEDVDRVLAELR